MLSTELTQAQRGSTLFQQRAKQKDKTGMPTTEEKEKKRASASVVTCNGFCLRLGYWSNWFGREKSSN